MHMLACRIEELLLKTKLRFQKKEPGNVPKYQCIKVQKKAYGSLS